MQSIKITKGISQNITRYFHSIEYWKIGVMHFIISLSMSIDHDFDKIHLLMHKCRKESYISFFFLIPLATLTSSFQDSVLFPLFSSKISATFINASKFFLDEVMIQYLSVFGSADVSSVSDDLKFFSS